MGSVGFAGLVFTLLVMGCLGYPPQGRLMPDGAPVPEDAVVHEDSVASASEVEEYEDSDDSDMYMEPEESEDSHADTSQDHTEKLETTDLPATESYAGTVEDSESKENNTAENSERTSTRDQEAKNTEQASIAESGESEEKSLETDSQNFFPSFAELFANQRSPFSEQQRYRPNRFLGYFQRDRSAYQSSAAAVKDVQHPILGSGNFGVIPGGTYYPEDKENDEYTSDEGVYNPYYQGRARSNYYRNPKPQPIRGGDFFANFRDFADITAPPKSSFSHLSVVYANKNGSTAGRITEPRNIMETLRMLEEEESGVETTTTTEEPPKKKLSKGKWKLMKIKQYQDDKARRTRLSVEPLLALS